MSANRVIYGLVVLTLLMAIFFTFQQAASTGAIERAGQSNTQPMHAGASVLLGGHRGGINPHLFLSQPLTPASVSPAP